MTFLGLSYLTASDRWGDYNPSIITVRLYAAGILMAIGLIFIIIQVVANRLASRRGKARFKGWLLFRMEAIDQAISHLEGLGIMGYSRATALSALYQIYNYPSPHDRRNHTFETWTLLKSYEYYAFRISRLPTVKAPEEPRTNMTTVTPRRRK